MEYVGHQMVLYTKITRGPDKGSDHQLVISKLKLNLKRTCRQEEQYGDKAI